MNWVKIQAKASRDWGVPWEVFDRLELSQLIQIAEGYNEEQRNREKLTDARLAQLQLTLCRLHGDKKTKLEDFLPKYQEPEKPKDKDTFETEKKAEISRIHNLFAGIAVKGKL